MTGRRSAAGALFSQRQQGMATLMTSLVLLMAMSIVALTAARTGIMEQRMAGNDLRAREAAEASGAGLEYGLAYAMRNYTNFIWNTAGNTQTYNPSSQSGAIAFGAYEYNPLASYRRRTGSNYILAKATASASGENAITASSQQHLLVSSILTRCAASSGVVCGAAPPPIVVDGCTAGIIGHPDVYPAGSGIAIATSHSETGSFGDGSDADNPCLKEGHLNTHGGRPQGNAFSSGDVWGAIFNINREQFQALARADAAQNLADEQRTYVWESDSGPYQHSYGSADHPVILVFAAAADCPPVSGNQTVYGIVFYDSPCTANGWGGLNVYGSIIFNGDAGHLNSNAAVYGLGHGLNPLPGDLSDRFVDAIAKVPGTWRDF